MKVLTIGEILVEFVATTKGEGFLQTQPLIGPFPSGAPAIFIDQVAKMGIPCAILSRVGNDDFGHLNLIRLQQDGVDTRGIAIIPNETTGSAFVRYQQNGERKFIFNLANSASGKLDPLHIENQSLIEQATHLHIMGSALAIYDDVSLIITAIKTVKARGGTLSFDPNLRAEISSNPKLKDLLQLILTYTDIFLPSGDELYLLNENTDKEIAIQQLYAMGIKHIVWKQGKQGAYYLSSNKEIYQPAYDVAEIDPTGAGDCFGATFVSCWLQKFSIEQCLKYASAAGARAVSVVGPMEGTSTLLQLEDFIQRQ